MLIPVVTLIRLRVYVTCFLYHPMLPWSILYPSQCPMPHSPPATIIIPLHTAYLTQRIIYCLYYFEILDVQKNRCHFWKAAAMHHLSPGI